MIKRALAAVLPPAALSVATGIRQRLLLARVPGLPFAADRLAASPDVPLGRILDSAAIAASWAVDGARAEPYCPAGDLSGGVNPGDRRALYTLVRHFQPRRVLEIGTHIGASTIHVGLALKTTGFGHLDTVDIQDVNDPVRGPWKTSGASAAPVTIAAALGLADVVSFHVRDALGFLRSCEGPYDLIFLDGDHSAPAVYRELSAALACLAPGGVILLHDYYPDGKPLFPGERVIPGPYLAVRRAVAENPAIAVLPLGKLPWRTKRASNVTSLAIVTRRG